MLNDDERDEIEEMRKKASLMLSDILWDIPTEFFPMVVKAINNETGQVWWDVHIEGPGMLQLPTVEMIASAGVAPDRDNVRLDLEFPERGATLSLEHGEFTQTGMLP